MNKRLCVWILMGILAVFSASVRAEILYNLIDLGTLGADGCWVNGINDSCVIVGSGNVPGASYHGFVWTLEDGFQIIEEDAHSTYPRGGLNENGVIVYEKSVTSVGNVYTYIWDQVNPPELIRDGTGVPFSGLGNDLNEVGQLVGQYDIMPNYKYEAYIWDETNGVQLLGTLGGEKSWATGINNNGVIVGGSTTADEIGHAFIWDPVNLMQDIGTLDGQQTSMAGDINEKGQVVGISGLPFIWDIENGMRGLGTLGGLQGTAEGINESGQVVGRCLLEDGGLTIEEGGLTHGYLWVEGIGMVDLNECLDESSDELEIIAAVDINNHGQIVGWGINPDTGWRHAYLLNPVPEPATILILGFGAMALLKRQR